MIFEEIMTMLSYEFMQRAFIGGIVFAITAPVIGYYMLLRGYSGVSDGISHIALLGIAAGLIIGSNPTPIAFIITILISFLLEYFRHSKALRAETSISIFIVLSLSLVSILNQQLQFSRSLTSLLFGSLSTITSETIIWSLIVMIITCGFAILKYNKLMSLTLSEELAKLSGVRVLLYNYTLIALVAMVVVIGIDVVGGLLVGSLMIVPIAAASQFSTGFRTTHITGVLISVYSMITGLLLAWFADFPPGASVAIISVIMFFICYVTTSITSRNRNV